MMILSDGPPYNGEIVWVGVIFHDLSMAPSWELTYFRRVMANWHGKYPYDLQGFQLTCSGACRISVWHPTVWHSQDADAAAGAAVSVEIVALAKTNMSNEKKGPRLVGLYRGWNPTQLYRGL